jgi:antagonist of KipI
MGSIRVIRPGLHTTVQDLGRWGFQAQGVPVSGAMDSYAHRLANRLVGNRDDSATLEVTLAGADLLFDDPRAVAVTGATFDLELDGQVVPPHAAFDVRAGSVLRFGARRNGARAYVAISGGLDVPVVLGSRSTHVGSRVGGIAGRMLVAGDSVPLGSATSQVASRRVRSALPAPATGRVRVVAGPHVDRFAPGALDALQASAYRVLPQSNRMGFRLSGPPLEHASGADIVSDATPVGALQVPASGQPILLMADHQTTGGYTIVAVVITADLGLAAQLAPGDLIQFEVCKPGQALSALIARERALMAVGASLP